ncbi:MAG: formylglycine-generating enzyme family protein [Myxococcota bacterium]
MRKVAITLAALVSLLAVAKSQSVGAPPRVHLAGGWFLRGSSDADLRYAVTLCERTWGVRGRELCRGGGMSQLLAAESPQRRVWVSAFSIDRTEVTRRGWSRCVQAGRCPPPRTPAGDPRLSTPEMPVTGVTFHEASDYCEFVGGVLPTEAQWERAARGSDGRRFPWGQEFNDRFANHRSPIDGFRYLAPVGSFLHGASPHGLVDMAGNAWEWTRDRFDVAGFATGLSVDPRGPTSGGERVTRGGSWRTTPEFLRTTMRRPLPAGASAPDLGFRCAYE